MTPDLSAEEIQQEISKEIAYLLYNNNSDNEDRLTQNLKQIQGNGN